jgi:hypothetical protein
MNNNANIHQLVVEKVGLPNIDTFSSSHIDCYLSTIIFLRKVGHLNSEYVDIELEVLHIRAS